MNNLMLLPYWPVLIKNNDRNAIERCAPSGPQKTFNKGVERASRLFLSITRNTCISEPREARGGIKCQGWKGERIGVNVHV